MIQANLFHVALTVMLAWRWFLHDFWSGREAAV